MNKKETITFRSKIPAGEKMKFSERVKDNGTVESIKLRFYMGQEMQLKVLPYVKHIGNKVEYFTTSPTNDYYLSGDDDYFIIDTVTPVNYDDEIVVEVINASNEYEYDLCCDISIDYYNGTDRVVGGVI